MFSKHKITLDQKNKSDNSFYHCLLFILIIGILISRIICIPHEMYNHPDEKVFVHSSVSIANVLLGIDNTYSELKAYPEGSYFFYAPFQLVKTLLHLQISPNFVNRIGSSFYYIIGCIAGLQLIRRYFKSRSAAIFYALLCTFSLFHIEQSRYGTSDSVSFALLMLCVFYSAKSLESGRDRYTNISFILVGFAASVKYPLVYFALLPICTILHKYHANKLRCIARFMIGALLTLAGFMMLSPGVIEDIHYISTVVKNETDAYIFKGNLTEVGGILNHTLSVLIYWILYSDILFSPVFLCVSIRCLKLQIGESQNLRSFFVIILPAVLGGFFIYNLFVTTLFMRTLYPFFSLILPYIAHGLSILWKQKQRFVSLLLIALVLRGNMMISAMSSVSNQDHLEDCIHKAMEISGSDRITGLGVETYITGKNKHTGQTLLHSFPHVQNIPLDALRSDGFPDEIQNGSVLVTGSLEFGKAAPYFFNTSHEDVNRLISEWKEFKLKYKDFYIGQSYPQYYGYLFGSWVKGTNLSEYDFPTNYVYAIPK